MSERKVLNKYYPPDFDPSKIPRMKLSRNRQYTVRLMAPFNMRCVTCGEYIYKGKKFNARKEDVENQDYLGIRIYRFYIKCTRCLQEISFKTDPKNTDYEIEAGATRNFMALKLAEEQAKREEDELKEEEANNPMKLLENRTEQSRNEIELLESLEELKDLNRRQAAVDYDTMLQQYAKETPEERRLREEKEDEEFVKSVKFENKFESHKRIILSEEIIEEEEDLGPSVNKKIKTEAPEELESQENGESISITTPSISSVTIANKLPIKKNESWNRSVGVLSRKNGLSGLVKIVKKPAVESTISNDKSQCINDGNSDKQVTDTVKVEEDSTSIKQSSAPVLSGGGGLSLLAGYSDSDSNQDSE